MSSKAKLGDISKRNSVLAQMITWLDGYAELHIVDPVRIEKLLESRGSPGAEQVWEVVKDDVTTITDLPASSGQVKKFSRLASYARLVSIVMVLVSFAFIEIYFFHAGLVPNPLEALVLIFGTLYISLMVNLLASRRMNSCIRALFEEHAAELSRTRSRIRQSTQTLIDRLQHNVVSYNLNTERFKFQLFFTKYNNIELLGKRGSRYSAVVRTKKHSVSNK